MLKFKFVLLQWDYRNNSIVIFKTVNQTIQLQLQNILFSCQWVAAVPDISDNILNLYQIKSVFKIATTSKI